MSLFITCLIIFGISILPIETTIAGNPLTEISFYQNAPVINKNSTQKHHKKKRKKKRGEFIVIVYRPLHKTGGCWGRRPTFTEIVDPSILMSDSQKPDDPATTNLLASHKNNIPELPDQPILPKMEFILPAVLMFRRKKRMI